jgi:hypothetical protein
MNLQRFLLLFVVVAVAATVMYVPWNFVDEEGHKQPAGYGLIWKPPVLQKDRSLDILGLEIGVQTNDVANQVDTKRLAMQLLIVVAIGGGLVLLSRKATSV